MNDPCFKHTTKQGILSAFRLGALSNLPAVNSEEMKHSLCQVSDCTFINHTAQYLLFSGNLWPSANTKPGCTILMGRKMPNNRLSGQLIRESTVQF